MNLLRASACLCLTFIVLATSGCTITGPSILGIAKMIFSCVPEGTAIDTPTGGRPIELIKPGDLVIGYRGEPVQVLQAHSYSENPVPERFYRLHFGNHAVVEVCDMHRVAGVRAGDLHLGMNIGGSVLESSETFGGVVRSYDLLTEDQGYRIQGIPVNSMIDELARTARSGERTRALRN